LAAGAPDFEDHLTTLHFTGFGASRAGVRVRPRRFSIATAPRIAHQASFHRRGRTITRASEKVDDARCACQSFANRVLRVPGMKK
jgi:hypothetical protein